MSEHHGLAAVILVLMSAAGALARLFNRAHEKLNLWRVLAELFTAGFTGMLLFFISQELKISSGWMYAAAGVAGWIGPQVIDWIAGVIEKKAGVALPKTDKEEKTEEKKEV